MQRNAKLKLALVLVSLAIGLVFLEISLRVVCPQKTLPQLKINYPAMFSESDYLPYRLRPGYTGRLRTPEFDTTIRINSLGFRDKEFARTKKGQYRILFLGDSFTFGWGVEAEESYPKLTEKILQNAHPPRPVETINAGFACCYSPDTYYLYLKKEGVTLDPDLIVVGFYIGNDIDFPGAFEDAWSEVDTNGLPLKIEHRFTQVVDHYWEPRNLLFRYRVPVIRNSHVFQGIVEAIGLLDRKVSALFPHAPEPVPEAGRSDAAPVSNPIPYDYRKEYLPRTEFVFKRVQQLFLGMKREADKHSIPILVVMIPEKIQLERDPFPGLDADLEKPQRLFSRFFQENGIAYLDLLPYFRERADKEVFYFKRDEHFNVSGHKLAASLIAQWLQSHGVPSSFSR